MIRELSEIDNILLSSLPGNDIFTYSNDVVVNTPYRKISIDHKSSMEHPSSGLLPSTQWGG